MYRTARLTAEDEATGLHGWIASATVVRGKLAGLTGAALYRASAAEAQARNSDGGSMRLKIACLSDAERHAKEVGLPMEDVVAGYGAIQSLNRIERADASVADSVRQSVLLGRASNAKLLALAKAAEANPLNTALFESLIGTATPTPSPAVPPGPGGGRGRDEATAP